MKTDRNLLQRDVASPIRSPHCCIGQTIGRTRRKTASALHH